MHKSVAEHSDLIPDEHEWIFRKQKSLYMRREMGKRKLTAVCSHQTRIGNLDAHLI